MGRVASFGSVNVDRVANVDAATLADLRERHEWFPDPGETRAVEQLPDELDEHVGETLLGGKGANQAVAAARAGADSRLLGAVGRDEADDDVLATLADRGVDVSAVESVDAPTGTAYVFVDPDGENYIAISAGANAAVDPDYAHGAVASVREADVLLLQNEVPAEASVALLDALATRDDRPVVILDPAPAPGAGVLVHHPCVDVVTPNETEAAALTDDLADFEGIAIETRGAEPVVVETGSERFEVTPPRASPVDTTGAGDVFAGYLAAELAGDADLRAAVELACAAASTSVEAEGVQRATPDRDAVRRRPSE